MKPLLAVCFVTAVIVICIPAGLSGVSSAEAHTISNPTFHHSGEFDDHDGGSYDQRLSPVNDSTFNFTEYRITIHENTSAEWTVRYTRTLENDSEREEFEIFADEFNSEETQLYSDFIQHATDLTDRGEKETGRTMIATNFDRHSYIDVGLSDAGIVEMSFIWTDFAVDEGERIVGGDVFKGGLALGENQRIVFEPGDGLSFDDATPPPDSISHDSLSDSNSVTWDQKRQFTDQRPRVVLVDSVTLADNREITPTPTSFDSQNDSALTGPVHADLSGNGNSMWWFFLGILIVLLGGGAAIVYRHNGGIPRLGMAPQRTIPRPPLAENELIRPPNDLLSDEDHVINLLEANGGRMKQVKIVDQTDWSKSKVSMLLSDMEERGTVSKLRMGRENIVSLKGHEPDATRSALEDR